MLSTYCGGAGLLLPVLTLGALLACLWRWRRGGVLWAALALFCRVLMGFSRSVFDSGLRTFTPLALLLCAACALLAGELRHKRAAWAILGCGAGAVVLNF